MSNQNKYERGSVYLVEEFNAVGHEQKKTRPWVLVSASPINKASSTIVAIPLSTVGKIYPPLSIKVLFNNVIVTALIMQVRALDKIRVIRYEGELDQYELEKIEHALKQVLVL